MTSVRRHWPIGIAGEVEVLVESGDDVERPSGCDFHDGRDRPIAEEGAGEARTYPVALIYRADHEALPQIEQRIGAISLGVVIVLGG